MATRSTKPVSVPRLTFRGKLMTIFVLAVVALCFQALSHWGKTHAFMVNESESLPNWAFIVESGKAPARGDYVVFAPGHDPLVTKYFGEDPPAFAKIALGVAGDVVTRNGRDVLINGQRVASTKPRARLGDVLAVGPTGVIPAGCVYAGSGHKDGFDSRYAAIGFVCRDRLAGVGRPIL